MLRSVESRDEDIIVIHSLSLRGSEQGIIEYVDDGYKTYFRKIGRNGESVNNNPTAMEVVLLALSAENKADLKEDIFESAKGYIADMVENAEVALKTLVMAEEQTQE